MTTSGPELYILGGIELRGVPPENANRLLAQSKVVALLAFLALSPRGRFQRRDRIVGLLWPDLDQEHARAALRKTVHAVRSVLGPDTLAARGDEELTLADGALWCDAAEFTAAADAGHLMRALELYKPELLDGFHLSGCSEFGQWLDNQRNEARTRAAAASWAMALQHEKERNLTVAAKHAKQTVRYAGTDERVLRRTLSMLDRLGDRAGALQLYEDFAKRLREEFDAEVSDETKALVAAWRGN